MAAGSISADRIQIEHLFHPLGIDTRCPEIQWIPVGAKKQSAFRVVEKDRAGQLLFDSGKVLSSATVYQPPNEKQSRDAVTVELELWDEMDRKGEVRSTAYELGLTAPEDFKARWPQIRARLEGQLVPSAEIERRLRVVGAPATPEEIGSSVAASLADVRKTIFMRDRYMALDFLALTGQLEGFAQQAFAATK